MKSKKIILAAFMACMSLAAVAVNPEGEEVKGKAIIKVFANFHTGFGNTNDNRGFDLERSYLGYQYNLGKGLTVKGVMDIGKSKSVEDYQRIAYIKNAMISWKHGNFTLNGGLISTIQFGVQEKFWGYRYIMKSFQDQYKFGHSADLGVSFAYRFADWIYADVIVANGEGYKKVQVQDGLMYGLGVTVSPVKDLKFRIYGGMNEAVKDGGKDIYNLAAFAGYKNKFFSLGCEYSMMKNSGNTKDCDLSGVSAYTSIRLCDFANAFVRYDYLTSKHDWNEAKDEQAVVAGAEFKVCKYVKMAPDFRYIKPAASGADSRYMAFINCYFGF